MYRFIFTTAFLWTIHSLAFSLEIPPTASTETKSEIMESDSMAMDSTLTEAIPVDSTLIKSLSADTSTTENLAPQSNGLNIYSPFLSKLRLSGTAQLKGLYHDFASDRDADKSLSLNLRRMKMDFVGELDKHAGFRAGLMLDGNGKSFGLDDGYLYYSVNSMVGFKGGKLKRPFSQEALQSSKSLYTIERGAVYQSFLSNNNGYSNYDLGLIASGGFVDAGHEVTYEIGLFNGKQNDNVNSDFSGQQNESVDKGFVAKDLVMRVTASPINNLKLEAALSTKSAEDKNNPNEFKYAVNTAYEFGISYMWNQLILLGEVAWGDNHNKQDSRIIKGSTDFFAFYATGIWREEYSRGRASELIFKVEGLDPDYGFGEGEGRVNDGQLYFTVGTNYFFTPRLSLMVNYGILKPITKVVGEGGMTHNLDAMWRVTF